MREKTKKSVAAVVVTYNRKELLRENIECLRKQTFSDLDILIIDNHSTDGTHAMLEPYIQRNEIIYQDMGENLGGAGGFQRGIKLAAEAGYSYIWVMDDDCMPTEDALQAFMDVDERLEGKYGFLSSKVLWKDGNICRMNVQKRSKWKKLRNFECLQAIQYASFVSLLLKADTVRTLGLPYKEFFIWADDWEYTRRISKKSQCFFVPQSIVNHWCVSNVGADIVTVDAPRMKRFKYMYRNDVVMYRQDGLEGIFYLMIRNVLHTVRILIKSSEKKEKIALMCKATYEGFRFHPKIEYPKDVE